MNNDRPGDMDMPHDPPKQDANMGNGVPMDNRGTGGGVLLGSPALRPVFLGNLSNSYTSGDIMEIFERPINPPNANFKPVPVDRVDLKRGYCFVFLKDAVSQDDKDNVERFVSDINGMYVPYVLQQTLRSTPNGFVDFHNHRKFSFTNGSPRVI
mmetsp:Transcript_32846/g.49552  ORF Transcript_32846/g.49552 Transcript_32846/m.49552 type:complete len:154 (+) Transcript_32846:56-517(+)